MFLLVMLVTAVGGACVGLVTVTFIDSDCSGRPWAVIFVMAAALGAGYGAGIICPVSNGLLFSMIGAALGGAAFSGFYLYSPDSKGAVHFVDLEQQHLIRSVASVSHGRQS